MLLLLRPAWDRCKIQQSGNLPALQVWDLIVVGAGVAGAALAYSQGQVCCAARARARSHRHDICRARHPPVPYCALPTRDASPQDGRRVLLLERDFTQPDRIVGELLQPGGYLMLKKLGLEECTDNIDAQRVRTLRRFDHAVRLLWKPLWSLGVQCGCCLVGCLFWGGAFGGGARQER